MSFINQNKDFSDERLSTKLRVTENRCVTDVTRTVMVIITGLYDLCFCNGQNDEICQL